MCINCHYIYNHYARRSILVKCGKCPACLQEKACMRSNRIRNNVTSGTLTLFITLTYANDYVPYILRSELSSDSIDVNVYRSCSGRFVYSRYSGLRFKKQLEVEIIDSVYVPVEFRNDFEVNSMKSLVGMPKDKIGVCLNSDFQNFIKRLKQILSRRYNYEKKFSYFYCSEYGSHTFRPHFHALLFIPSCDDQIFRRAVLEAWPYADSIRTQKYIETARDAASYVSSYVNSHIGVSSALSIPKFKSSHHYSQGFGVVLDCFTLPALLEKVESGDLYYYRSKQFDGESCVAAVPIPTYVINRYFPILKGFGRCDASTLESVLLAPTRCGEYFRDYAVGIDNPVYHYSSKESYQMYVRLENCFQYFHKVTGLNRFDYVLYYRRIWNLHFSICLKLSHEKIEDINEYKDFYENANDLISGVVRNDSLSVLGDDFVRNPNLRSDIVRSTLNLLNLYFKLDKQKKVTNYSMSSLGHNV